MTDKLSAKLRMYKQLLTALKKHASSWQNVPAFVVAVQVLEEEVNAINAANVGLQGTGTGLSEDKATSKKNMIEEAVNISGALLAYAHDIGSQDLEANAALSKSDFHNSKEVDADDLALHIHQLGTTYIAQLADYGVAQEDLDGLAKNIENFSEKIGQPKELLNSTKEIRARQQAHFDKADEMINKKLDNLVNLIRKKDQAFFDAYQNARAVTWVGSRQEQSPVSA